MPFSPKKPASMIGTFAMVLFFTMLKEAYEDYQRAVSDKEMNTRRTKILDCRSGEVRDHRWLDIKVGDIVKVEKDQEVPADLLLIHASKDVVFVSTMNLDGETNLKDRELCVTTLNEKRLPLFGGTILCDEANASLDNWEGNLTSPELSKIRSCNIKNLLLRGTTLKNIDCAYGICVYVGTETKIFKNSKPAPRKISNLMKVMNKMLYTVFAFQIVIIVVFATLSLIWIEQNQEKLTYLDIGGKLDGGRWIVQFFTYWVAYSHMIPISLYVIIEMLKLGQTKLINADVKMFFAEDMSYALCRNSDLIEELGQVEFVFSDKTGTLTQNKMEFKKCHIGETVYGNQTETDIANNVPENEGMRNSSVEVILSSLKGADKDNKLFDELYQMFRLLAVCHTVVVDHDPRTQEITYQASSPDELALI